MQTKTKEFSYISGFKKNSLDEQINDFIKDKKLIDIKYQVNENDDWIAHRALVIYADNKEGEE